MNYSLNLEQEKIFKENEELIQVVIDSEFTYNYFRSHGLDREDIEQHARLGMIYGIKTYNKDKGTKLTTHLANNIKFGILNGIRRESLRTVNRRDTKTREELHSLDEKEYQIGEAPKDELVMIDWERIEKLDSRLPQIIKLLVEGYNKQDVAKEVKVSRPTLNAIINRNATEIKDAIETLVL